MPTLYDASENRNYEAGADRWRVYWWEFPADYTDEMWDEYGPDCLLCKWVSARNKAEAVAAAKDHAGKSADGCCRIVREQFWVSPYVTGHGEWEAITEPEDIGKDDE